MWSHQSLRRLGVSQVDRDDGVRQAIASRWVRGYGDRFPWSDTKTHRATSAGTLVGGGMVVGVLLREQRARALCARENMSQ
eukprot:4352609-Pyramimonas_sp.AAC.1